MKPAFYESLDKIPDGDKNDYKLETAAGSPYFNKYVLDLDPQHPVAMKNTELLGEKSTRDATQAAAVQTAIAPLQTQIGTLTQQLQSAQANTGLPAGHIAVPADTLTVLNNFKGLGEFDDVKKKVDEYGTLKQESETNARMSLYSEIAEANGMDEKAFAKLAEPVKLHERIESREVDDGKGKGETVKQYFVKGKNEKNEDTSTAIAEFVKKDGDFSPFVGSLFLSETDRKNRLPIPNQKHGDKPAEASGGKSYVASRHKRVTQKASE